MTITEIVKKLEPWKARHDALMAQYDAMYKLTRAAPDSELWTSIFDLWGAYTAAVGEQIGDKGEWLQWYECECDMGKKPMKAYSLSAEIEVRTLRQLARVIAW